MKQKLLYNPEYWTNLTTFFLEPIWNQYFERVAIEPGQQYDPNTHIVFANFSTADNWIDIWKDKGFRIVIDHTWDTWVLDKWESDSGMLVLRNSNWSWYNESLWYRELGYNNYKSNQCNSRTFLMLMNLRKPHRDQIYKKVQSMLDNAIYSYHGIGQPMVGAVDKDPQDVNWQRYIDPDWYDATKFSLVVESSLTHTPLAHSEKSYKPMAFKHPTVSWGSPGLLKYLQSQGFVTFDNRIDESYDNIHDDSERLLKVVQSVHTTLKNIKKDPDYFNDPETQSRLEHNFNLFYNFDLVNQRFKIEIIDPILEFACKH
jgi:hypothetical protein